MVANDTVYYGKAVQIFIKKQVYDVNLAQITLIAHAIEEFGEEEAEKVVEMGEAFRAMMKELAEG